MGTDDQGFTATGKPRKSNKGRPSKITPTLVDAIISSLKAGCYLETAAAFSGITRSTLQEWMKRGRKELERLSNPRTKPSKTEVQFVILINGITRAMAEAEIRDVSQIAKAALGGQKLTEEKIKKDNKGNIISHEIITKMTLPQWQASAWRLERKYPKRWGRRLAISNDTGKSEDTPKDYAEKLRESMGIFPGLLGGGDLPEEIPNRHEEGQEEQENDQQTGEKE